MSVDPRDAFALVTTWAKQAIAAAFGLEPSKRHSPPDEPMPADECAELLSSDVSPPLETGCYCVLGTAHLSTTTAELLDRWCADEPQNRPLAIADSGYGWFVPTGEIDPGRCKDVPADLLAAMCFARKRGFDHILFDCDEATVEGLPVFDW